MHPRGGVRCGAVRLASPFSAVRALNVGRLFLRRKHDAGSSLFLLLTRSAAIAAFSLVRPAFASLLAPARVGFPMPSHGMSQSFSACQMSSTGRETESQDTVENAKKRGISVWPPQREEKCRDENDVPRGGGLYERPA